MVQLTAEQLETFHENGFVIIPEFYTVNQVQQMHERSHELLRAFPVESHPKTTFSTREDSHTGDLYFLQSADGVGYFLEEGALNANGELTVPKERAVNKIGHALHLLDPVFQEMTTGRDDLIPILKQLGFQSPVVLQSMLIFKQPRIGGKVAAHQDSTFLHTEPQTTVGFWFPLENATRENGTLSFIPGSHKTHHKMTRRFVRNPAFFRDADTLSKPKQPPPPNTAAVVFRHEPGYVPLPEDDDAGYVTVEVPAGAAVVLHGSVVHKSPPNLSDKSRFIYAFHVVDNVATYSKENWLQCSLSKPLY